MSSLSVPVVTIADAATVIAAVAALSFMWLARRRGYVGVDGGAGYAFGGALALIGLYALLELLSGSPASQTVTPAGFSPESALGIEIRAGVWFVAIALMGTGFALFLGRIRHHRHEEDADRNISQSVLRNLRDGYIRADRDGIIRYASGSAAQIFGYPTARLIGSHAGIFYRSPEDRENLLRKVDEAGGQLKLGGIRTRRKDGSVIRVDFTAQRIADGSDCDGGLESFVRDVSGEYEADEARQTSEERFRDFAEMSSDWLWETDPDHRIVWLSDGFDERSGKRGKDLIGLPIWETFSENYSSQTGPGELRTLMEAGGPVNNLRYTMLRPDGERAWRRLNGHPRFDGGGNFLGYRGATSDITEIVDAESRFRGLIESSPDMIFVHRSGRIVYANPALVSGFRGNNAEEFLDRDTLTLIHPDDREMMGERRRAQIAGEPVAGQFPVRLQRNDGSGFFGESTIARIAWEGEPAIMVNMRDVTDRILVEQRVRDDEQRFRDFAQSTSDWFWELGPDLRFSWISTESHPLAGSPAQNVVGRFPWQISGVDPAGSPAWGSLLRDHLEKHKPFRDVALEGYRAGGERYFISASGTPVFARDGAFLGFRGSSTDVTTQIDLENRLRQAMKMEAIGQLTGGIAHDFNNLLAIISGNLELLDEQAAGDDSVTPFLAPALRAAERGADLTRYLLAFSRQQPLSPRPVDIGELIDGMTDPLRRALGARVELETIVAADGWPAHVDPAQTETAILNLALNARDAMPNGGRLTIETGNAELDEDYAGRFDDVVPGSYLMVSVSDEGVGIAPELIDRVFDPFVTTKDVGQGSGLGLSMVYGFVRQSGGHIRIDSEVGRGTTVRMYLPGALAGDAQEPLPPARAAGPQGNGETVLLVEDDPDVLNLANILLTNLNYNVLQAADPATAIDRLESAATVDLLLTDVILPGGTTGADLARRATAIKPDMPVVYMSGYTEGSIIHQGVLDEKVLLLSKPFKKLELADVVRRALEAGKEGTDA